MTGDSWRLAVAQLCLGDSMTLDLVLLLAALAAVIAALAAVLRPRVLVFALPLLAVLNGIGIPMGPASVRIDQLAACLLVFALGVSVLFRTRQLRTDPVVWWLAAILAANVVASVVNSPVRGYSLAQCANLASAWAIYVVIINFLDTRADLDRFLAHCLWAAGAACGVGILAFVLAITGLPVGGAEVSQAAAEHLTMAYGAYGTMFEPNIFGSFAGAMFTLAVGLLVSRGTDGVPAARLLRTVAALAAGGLVLSFTRAAWLGTMAAIVVLAVLGDGRMAEQFSVRRMLLPLGAAALVMLALVLAAGEAGGVLRFKLLNLVNLSSQTAALRFVTYAMALDQWLVHPLVGCGTFTFAPLVAQGSDFQSFEGWRNLWIGNFLLLALHDTGVLGLALWTGLVASILRRGARAARWWRADDGVFAQRLLALTAAVASFLVPFLATSGFSLGYTWVLIGLLGAHVTLERPSSSTTTSAP
jgi:O-antigen ligase